MWFPNVFKPNKIEIEYPEVYKTGHYIIRRGVVDKTLDSTMEDQYTLMGDGTVKYEQLAFHHYDKGVHVAEKGSGFNGKIIEGTDDKGNTTFELRFDRLPSTSLPPGRTL